MKIEELGLELYNRIEQAKEEAILKRLKELCQQDIIDYIKGGEKYRFPPMMCVRQEDVETWFIDDDTVDGFILIRFKLVWPDPLKTPHRISPVLEILEDD